MFDTPFRRFCTAVGLTSALVGLIIAPHQLREAFWSNDDVMVLVKKAHVVCSVSHDQKRRIYQPDDGEVWLSQNFNLSLAEYRNINVVFNSYSVEIFDTKGNTWIRRRFYLPKEIDLEGGSRLETSFYLNETILDLWNANNNQPDIDRVQLTSMEVLLWGIDEYGSEISVNIES